MDRRLSCTKCIPGIIRFVCLLLLITVICVQICTGFNVDLRHPVIYSSPQPRSTFGYSVALIKNGGARILLVGAPTGNSSHDRTYEPGVVYGCAIGTSRCSEVALQIKKEKIIRGRFYYEELRDKGWLGVSIDVAPDDSQFVACGHLWKDQQYDDELYLTNGACYAVSTNLSLSSIKKLLPLVRYNKQTIDTQYIYALGLSGFSAHYSRDETTLLLGAPGAYRFSGTVVAVNNYSKLLSNDPVNPDTLYRVSIPNLERNDDTYFGSAVTSGKFFENKKVYYVAGAPRQGPNGKVFIFLYPEDQDGEVDIKYSREGVQMGEYFGSSICALDFNADGFDDLVVGSPLYSSDIEEGRVSVYMSDKSNLRANPDYLTGSMAINARFGTTVVGIGDINLDGYNDLAVGAPYEGNGAVYIYHGSTSGIKKKFAQRIAASDIDIQLKGFGISISKGRDIDDNFYPDLAVGASKSDRVVILKSKPIIRIFGNASYSVNHININNQNCTLTNGGFATCFQVTICSLYNGKHASNSLDIVTIVRVDEHFERIEIFDGKQLVSNFNYTDSFQMSRPSCRTLDLFVKKNVQDVLTPVRLIATHFPVAAAHEAQQFCPTCPVIDINFSGEITKSLKFFTGCGDDDQCISDLQVEAKFSDFGSGNAFVLGKDDNLQLLISVINKGEPAFQASLRLSFPTNVDFTRIPSDCSFFSSENLTCSLGNPLNSSGIVSLNIPLDLKRVTTANPLVFDIEVTTASEELPTTLSDNRFSLNLPISSVTGVSFSGWTVFEEQFVFNRSNPGLVPVIHMYQISKNEPSPIDELNLEFKFPTSTKGPSTNLTSLIQYFSIIVSKNYVPVSPDLCTTAVENPSSPISILNHEGSEHGSAAVIDCASMGCHVLRCTLGPIVKRDSVTVNITATVDLTTITEIVGKDEKIIILRSFGSITGPGIDSKSSVRTIFVPQDLVPQSQGIAWWIILVAVLAGILLLGLLIFALYKFGFFQRNRPDPLLEESELNESRDEDESP